MTRAEAGKLHSERMRRLYAEGHKMGFQRGHKLNAGEKFEKGNVPWNKGKMGTFSHTEEHKRYISQKLKGIKRSESTKKKMSESQSGVSRPYAKPPHYSGAQHYNWKGGKDLENRRLKASPEYRCWRDAVYKRDRYSCQTCGLHCNSKNIVAHHIYGWADFPNLRFDINNGLTLCRSCHAKIHKAMKSSA